MKNKLVYKQPVTSGVASFFASAAGEVFINKTHSGKKTGDFFTPVPNGYSRNALLSTSLLSARHTLMVACAMGTLLGSAPALANPQGGTVTAGSASISRSGNTLTVNQTSNRAIIDWSSFNISSGETTQFQQPSSSSIAVNRDNSGSASQINGQLNANGNVIVINPQGTMIGKTGQVNANSFVATSSNINASQFMSGGAIQFITPGNPNAQVINNGSITVANAGLAGLVAPNTQNNGTITAQLGKVTIASGDTFTLDFAGDGITQIGVSQAVLQQLAANNGIIRVGGGSITLTAAAAGDAVKSLVVNTGTVNADSFGVQNGVISLYAGNGTVTNSGTIQARGINPGENGGSVTLTASDNVNQSGTVDVSGQVAGGTVNIAAQNVQQNGTVNADGQAGLGGTVDVAFTSHYADSAGSQVSASSIDASGGIIRISGNSAVSVIDASGTYQVVSNNGQGGEEDFLAHQVAIRNARFNARGRTGGRILIGADGTNGYRSEDVMIDAGTTIMADGTAGAGGSITIQADSVTMLGKASAQGVTTGGTINIAFTSLYSDGVGTLLDASGSAGSGGVIHIEGGDGANLSASGSYLSEGTTGGAIDMLAGNEVMLLGALLNTNGTTGGGYVRVGGSLHGAGTTRRSLYTYVDGNTTIDASATTGGNGGTVVVWSDNATYFGGMINAQGANGGNGGFVETSSHGLLTPVGMVSVGKGGSWLLDPADLTITTSTGAQVTSSGTNPITWATTSSATSGADSYLNAATVVSELSAGTNVIVKTSSNGSGGNGDITVASNITSTGAGNLTISAYRNIVVNTNIAITTQGGSVTLNADNASRSSGAIVMNSGSSITTNGGNISLVGGSTGTLYAYGVGASSYIQGVLISGATLAAGGGNITIKGAEYQGSISSGGVGTGGVQIVSSSSVTTTGNGTITITGLSGFSNSNTEFPLGVLVNGSTVSVQNNTLSVTGTTDTGSSAISGEEGVAFSNSAIIKSTGSGAITISGTANTASNGYDIGVDIPSATIQTVTGNITITGNASNGTGGGAIQMYSGTQITSTSTTAGQGTITLNGTSTDASSSGLYTGAFTITSAAGNVTVSGTGSTYGWDHVNSNGLGTITTTSGNISVTAGGATQDLSATSTGGITFGNVSTTGNIAFNVNTMALTSPTIKTTGNVTFANRTSGITIGVGSGAGTLAITDAILNATTLGTGSLLTIGSSNAGPMTINSAHSFNTSTTFQAGATNSDITLSGALASTPTAAGDTLTFSSDRNIILSNSVTANTTALNMLFDADNAGNHNGYINVGGTITSLGGSITMGGGSGTISGGTVNADGSVNAAASGFAWGNSGQNAGIVISSAVSAGGGTIIMNGKGYTGNVANAYGVDVNANVTTTGNGAIYLNGTGGSSSIYSTRFNVGVYVNSVTVSTVNGAIDMVGTGGAGTSDSQHGVCISGSTVETTGTGNMVLTGTGGANGSGPDIGVVIQSSSIVKTIGSSGSTDTITINATQGGTNYQTYGAFSLIGSSTLSTNSASAINIYATGGMMNLASGSITTQGGNVLLDSGYSNSTNGSAIYDAINISSNGGNITMGGSSTITASILNADATVGTAAAGFAVGNAMQSTGILISSAAVNSGGGNIIMNGQGYDSAGVGAIGVYVTGTGTVSAGSGTIYIAGKGMGVGGNGYGFYDDNSSSSISITNGKMEITGTGATDGTSAANMGIYIFNGVLNSTGTGNIYLNGTGGGTGNNNYGIYLQTGHISLSGGGSLVAQGFGSASATGRSDGIIFYTGAYINNSSTGSVTLTGTAQTGSALSNGVYILGNGTNGGILSTGSGATTITGTGSDGGGDISFDTTNNYVGGTGYSGAITLIANTLGGTAIPTIQTTGKVTFDVRTANTTIDIGGTSHGTLQITNSILTNTTAGSITIGDATNAGNTTEETTNSFTKPLSVISAGTITLTDQINDSASGTGNPVVVLAAGGNIVNNTGAGTSTIHLTGSSSPIWYVYSTQASGDTNGQSSMGPSSTTVYNTTYPTTTGASGNTWFYSGPHNEGTVTITANALSGTYGTYSTSNIGPSLTYSCSGSGCVDIAGALAVTGVTLNSTNTYYTYGAWTNDITQGTLNWATGFTGTINFTPATLTVSKAALTITGTTASNKTYDGTTAATLNTASSALSGKVSGDTVNLGTGSATGTFTSANVGNGITVNTSGFTLSGADSGNYSLAQPTTTASITARALTISGVTANNKTYDSTTAATLTTGGDSLVGVVGGDSVTLSNAGATGTFAQKDVATGIGVTASGFTISGASASNYTLTQPAGLSANITAAALTVTGVSASNKTYDGTTSATLSGTAALSGVYGGDTVTVSSNPGTGTFASANVGTGITVTPTTSFTLGGAQAGDYTLTQPTLTANISKTALTITATGQSGTYGGSFAIGSGQTSGYSTSGLQNGETIGSLTLSTNDTLSGSGNYKAGTYNITPSAATGGSFNAGNYTITYNADTGGLAVAQKALTITGLTAQNKTYDGTTADTLSGSAALSGKLSGDTVTPGGTATGAFADANVGSGKAVTISGSTISGADAANYSLTQEQGQTANITAAALTVAANNKTLTYGQGITYNGYTVTGTLYGSDSVTGATLSDNGSNNGTGHYNVGSYTITPSSAAGSGLSNYSITYNTGTLTVNPAALAITADNKTMTYGGGNPAFTYSQTGLASGETIGSVTLATNASTSGNGSYNVDRNGQGNVVSWAITPSGATGGTFSSANYTISYNAGTLTVNPAALTVTANAVSKTYDNNSATDPTLAFSYTGLTNGDSNATFTGTPVRAGSGNENAGSYLISQGTLTATGNYTIGSFNTNNFTINPATLTVTANAVNATYGDTLGTLTYGYSGLVGGDTSSVFTGALGVSNESSATRNAGTVLSSANGFAVTGSTGNSGTAGQYTIVQGSFSAGSNYTVTYNSANLTLGAKALTITGVSGTNKVYDATTGDSITGTASLVGKVAGDAVTLNNGTASFATPDVGTGKTVTFSGYSISGADAGNYTLTQPSGSTANIAAAAITVTASNQSRTYGFGGTSAALGTSGYSIASGTLQGGDTIGGVTLTTNASIDSNSSAYNHGTWNLTPSAAVFSSGNASNYLITYTTDTNGLSIAQRALTPGLAGTVEKTYDGTATATLSAGNYSLGGLVAGDSVSVGGTGTYDTPAAGTGKTVNVSGLALSGSNAGNYTLSSNSVSGVVGQIDKAVLTVSGMTASGKVYDGTTAATISNGGDTLGGVIASDSGNVSLTTTGTASFSQKDVGSNLTVTASGFTISGSAAGNYTLTQPTAIASITPASLTVTGVTAGNKTYDGTTAATLNTGSAALGGTIYGGDVVTLKTTGATGIFASSNVANGLTVTGSGFSLTGAQAGDYSLSQPSTTANITPASLSITANDLGKAQGNTLTFAGTEFTSSGLRNSETIGSVALSSAGAPANAAPGSYSINLSNATGGTFNPNNYTITYHSGTLTVTSGNVLTITAKPQIITYGQAYSDTIGDFTITGLQGSDTVTGVSLATNATNSASGHYNAGSWTLTPSSATGSDMAAYTIVYNPGTLTISKAMLSVAADSLNKTYGQANPALTYSVAGYAPGDGSPVITGMPSLSTTATSGSGIGSYTITTNVSGMSAANYNFTPVNGTLSIQRAVLTITASNQTVTYGASPVYGDTITGFVNGDTSSVLSGAVSNTVNATLTNGNPNAGSWAITPAQNTLFAANYNFNFVPGALTVNRATLTVTANNTTSSYGVIPNFSAVLSGFVNGDTAGVVSGTPYFITNTTQASSAGTYANTIQPLAGTLSASNYNFVMNSAYGTLVIDPAILTVTADNQSRLIGAANPPLTYNITGYVLGQNGSALSGAPRLATSADVNSGVGDYPVNVSNGTLSAGDYAFSFVPGTLSVTAPSIAYSPIITSHPNVSESSTVFFNDVSSCSYNLDGSFKGGRGCIVKRSYNPHVNVVHFEAH